MREVEQACMAELWVQEKHPRRWRGKTKEREIYGKCNVARVMRTEETRMGARRGRRSQMEEKYPLGEGENE